MIKESLAPSIAMYGIMQYWKGDIDKAFKKLELAKRWSPELFESSEHQAYFGLCLFRLGKSSEAKDYLEGSYGYLGSIGYTDNDLNGHRKSIKLEVAAALNEINT